MPYLRAKAQEYYEILGGGMDPDLFDEDQSPRRTSTSEDDVSLAVTRTILH